MVGRLGTGVELNEVFTVFSQGAMKETENPFDLALEGEGFLAVQTPDGERYTRNGSFLLNEKASWSPKKATSSSARTGRSG